MRPADVLAGAPAYVAAPARPVVAVSFQPARLEARDDRAAPFVPWLTFLAYFVASVGQGEHVSMVGQTRSGKTTLMLELLKARTDASQHWRSVVLGNKVRDPTLDTLAREPGWRRITKWADARDHDRRLLLWPKVRSDEDWPRLAGEVDGALRELFIRGRHTVYADEIRTLSQAMGLKALTEVYYLLGGSNGSGLWAGTQRAAHVPLEFYSQARWLILFRENSPAARKALANHVAGVDSAQVSRVASRLVRREFLCVDTWNDRAMRSAVEL